MVVSDKRLSEAVDARGAAIGCPFLEQPESVPKDNTDLLMAPRYFEFSRHARTTTSRDVGMG
jgi:hypothetical protein